MEVPLYPKLQTRHCTSILFLKIQLPFEKALEREVLPQTKLNQEMIIWCDFCSKKKASVFCPSDEAALCDDCDPSVHQANKLASKHLRFSLIQPSFSQPPPLCDICKEKKGMLFCQQDRAVVCIDCDVQIHTANGLTHKHNRFLLTGIKLSSVRATTSRGLDKSNSVNSRVDHVPGFRPQMLTTKWSASCETSSPHLNLTPHPTANTYANHDVSSQQTNSGGSCGGGSSTSSISEYLTMLPGWQVEDLLDSFSDPHGFSKVSESRFQGYEDMGLWVPQAASMLQPSPLNSGICGVDGSEWSQGNMGKEVSSKRMDDGFRAPGVGQQSVDSNKRSRFFC